MWYGRTSPADYRGFLAPFCPAPEANARRNSLLSIVFLLIGFTSVIAQVVLMREMIVVFHGNEIALSVILANWLLWTAAGSGLVGRAVSRSPKPRGAVAGLQIAVALLLPSTILAVRASKIAFDATPGELLGPGPMFLTSFVVLSLFCLASGSLFTAGSRLYAGERRSSTAKATGSVYLLEAVGSGAGGVLASLLLIRYLSAPQIALTLSLLNLAAAVCLSLRAAKPRWVALATLLAAAFFVLTFGSRALETASLRLLWRGLTLVESRDSVYGNLAVTQTGDTKTFYQSGLVLFTVPDLEAAEEAVHYALLQHESPKHVLMIGGGLNGGLNEALEHRSVESVDYVELDPMLLRLAREHLPAGSLPPETDSRVTYHHVDGRLFLKRTPHSYDVIVVNLPDPKTAQLNRFYTREFFQDAARKLTPRGVFSFSVTGAENYITQELAALLRCLNQTLLEVFPRVVVFPGATIHFFAAMEAGAITDEPAVLLARLAERHINTEYVREYYLPFRLTQDRLDDLRLHIRSDGQAIVNNDFNPRAYYAGVALWSTRFSPSYRRIFSAVSGLRYRFASGIVVLLGALLAGVIVWRTRGQKRFRAAAGLCAASMGFTAIGLEVLLLLAFQAVFGYVYNQLALLIAAFMAGVAVGSHASLRGTEGTAGAARDAASAPDGGRNAWRTLLWLQLSAAVAPLLLFVCFGLAANTAGAAARFWASNVLFPVLAILSGAIGGYQFPVASRAFYETTPASGNNAGVVYALDLIGACAGAAVFSAYLIPVFGLFKTAVVIVLANLAPTALLAYSRPGERAAVDHRCS